MPAFFFMYSSNVHESPPAASLGNYKSKFSSGTPHFQHSKPCVGVPAICILVNPLHGSAAQYHIDRD